MKGNSKTAILKELVKEFMRMEIIIKENGIMMKKMGMDLNLIKMEIFWIKGPGFKVNFKNDNFLYLYIHLNLVINIFLQLFCFY